MIFSFNQYNLFTKLVSFAMRSDGPLNTIK
jgi:hypothetical protein